MGFIYHEHRNTKIDYKHMSVYIKIAFPTGLKLAKEIPFNWGTTLSCLINNFILVAVTHIL